MSLMDDIEKRIREFGQRRRDVDAGGLVEPFLGLVSPEAQKVIRQKASIPLNIAGGATDAIDMALDALSYASTVGTGGLFDLVTDEDNPLAQGEMPDVIRRAKATTKNPVERLHLINEYYAEKHPVVTGILNEFTNPGNLVGGASALVKGATKAPAAVRVAGKAPGLAGAAQATREAAQVALQIGKQEQQAAKVGRRTVKVRDELTGIPKVDAKGSTKWRQENARAGLNYESWINSWKGQMVQTIRGLLQDYASGTVWAKDAGIKAETLTENFASVAREAAKRVKAGNYDLNDIYTILPERPGYLRAHYGMDNRVVTDKKGKVKTVAGMLTHDQMNELGQGAMESGTVFPKYLKPAVSAAVEAVQPMATPLRPKIPVVGQAIAGGQGYFRAGISGAYQTFNHMQHVAMRTAAWEQGFSRAIARESDEFLRMVDGIDPSIAADLRARSQANYLDATRVKGINLEEMTPDSMFTKEDILEAYGFRPSKRAGAGLDDWVKPRGMRKDIADSVVGLADDWQSRVLAAKDAGNARSIQVFRDFRVAEGSWAKKLGGIIPFSTWVTRAYPKTVEIMLNHPAMATALIRFMQASAEEEGLQPWEVGTIPIKKGSNPLANAIVDAVSGGRDAEVRVNFMQLLSPLPPEAFQGGDFEYADSPAEYIRAGMDTAGFGVTPPVDWALYLTGLSDNVPRSPSRIQGIVEGAPEALGEVPTARGIVSGIRKGQEKSAPYDPVECVAQELVFEETGLPVSDKRNKEYALQISRKEGVYQEAEALYEAGLRNRNIISQINPTNITTTSATARESRIARDNIPVDFEAKQKLLEMDPSLAGAIEDVNAAYKKKNPAAAIYDDAVLTAADKVDPRLQQWRALPENRFLANNAPRMYKMREEAFKKQYGIR